MEQWKMLVSFLMVVLLAAGGQGNHCTASRAKTCTMCIRVAEDCSYCADKTFTFPRCDLASNLLSSCKEIVTMKSEMHIIQSTRIDTSRKRTQISPQQVSMSLRAGEERTLNFEVFQPLESPIDLYFLMDFSYSMQDDLDNLKKLGRRLAGVVEKMSNDYTIGFGKFVDKVSVPQTDMRPLRLKQPWPNSDAPFSFKNVIPLTNDVNNFIQKLEKERISGNMDAPEGGFDAILQVAVCKGDIGWRPDSTHLLVFSTESAFHYEADGSNVLSGILKRNDEKCHLDNSGSYTQDTEQDYPSIPTLIRLLTNHGIIPIFAVTNHSYSYYEKLSKYFPVSDIGQLQEDSSNILDLLRHAFENIRSKMEIRANSVPKTMRATVSSLSAAKPQSESSTFTVTPGQVNKFRLSLRALEKDGDIHMCNRPQGDQEGIIILKPSTSTDSLLLNASLLCAQCPCEKKPEVDSPLCSSNGDFVCGQCQCKENWQGLRCDCLMGVEGNIADCINPKSNSSVPCSNRGECQCGICYCFPSEKHQELYGGTYCEYSNLLCPRYAGFTCNDRGKCFEEKCLCDAGWMGPSCECPISNATCIDHNGGLCNGKGICECGQCKCEDKNADPTCGANTYLQLLGLCEDTRTCVQCQAWNTGEKKGQNCNKCDDVFEFVEELKQDKEVTESCQFRDEDDDCTYYYTVEKIPNVNTTYLQVRKKKDCPPGGFLWLIPLIMFLMMLLGLLLLLCWKYCACCRACCARLPCCAMLPCCAGGTLVGFKEDHYMFRQSKLTSNSLDTPMVRTNKLDGTDIVRWKVTDNVHKGATAHSQLISPKDSVLYNLSLRAARVFNNELNNPDSRESEQLRLLADENLNEVYKHIPGAQTVQKTKFRTQPHAGKRSDLTIIDTQLPAPRSAEPEIMKLTEHQVTMGTFNDLKVVPGYYTVASDRGAQGQVEFQDGVELVDVRVPLFVKDEDDDEKRLLVEAVDVPLGTAEITKRFVDITIIKEAAKSSITFLQPSYTCQRQDKVANIALLRDITEDGRTQVSYKTRDLTAKDGKDYVSVENEVTFLPGETRKEIPVKLLEQTEVDSLLGNEQIKQFLLELYKPRNGAKLGKFPRTTVTIGDDNVKQRMDLNQSLFPIDLPPLNVKPQPIDSKRIRVNWSPAVGDVTGYKLKYWPEDDEFSSKTVETRNTSVELTDLQPSCDYAMEVSAYNTLGAGPCSNTVRCRTLDSASETIPLKQGLTSIDAPPSNVKVQPINSRKLRVNWIPPPGRPTGYKVTYWIEGDENSSQVVTTATPSAELPDLYPYCDYEMNIFAYNALGAGPRSETVSCRTPEDLPNEPGRLAFNVLSPTVTQLSWAEPSEANGEILEYEVSYTMVTDENQPIGPKKMVKINKPKKRMVMIENLKEEQPYRYAVRARNGAGWGPPREATMNLSTQPKRPMSIPIIPDIPIIDAEAHDEYENFLMYSSDVMRSPRPSVSDDTDMQMNGRWETNTTFSGGTQNTITQNTGIHSQQFTRTIGGVSETLAPGQGQWMSAQGPPMHGMQGVDYTVTQRMIGGRRRTESEDVNAALENLEMALHENRSPGVPNTPTRLVFSALGATSLKVSWQNPPCEREVLAYRVTYQSLAGGEMQTVDIPDPNENSLIINDLLPNYSYMFKVKALSDKGWGPDREGVITIESKVDPMSPLSPIPGSPFTLSTPSAPGPLVFTAINSELLKLSWEKPRKPNGDIMGYVVTCEPLGGQDETKTYQVEGDDAEMTLMVPHLSENVPYKFKVQAKTTQGFGPEREGIITIESQDAGSISKFSKQTVMRNEEFTMPGNMSTETSLMQSTIDPFFSDGMTVTTQRMEGGTSVTQQVTRTMMTSGTVTKQVERKFYEA
ncbi:integrin beta-4 isoform X1 [Amblyraja radiata]|uniref:integrin beta-4 isoform X1 n=1 Tax=Amblyraja radiata TaxID=386614 RepID=UPI001401D034|nr:integrin beta-4 isoform X1 [Amblyraja radiata]XP_032900296.1 integrin beta-4 isoform X1 [Amblyraja radiata]XP_032900297.1 integrin beta-4 isoform X1 [Amblyraja radiata]XP_032900298.1 integrin beta-4 isoform X1 [Amblyraja radiata]XP_032900300.1 integrin beta-4 isoform X1 [Amblyraja radiata]